MAISLSFFPILPLLLLLSSYLAQAATVTYDFNITWVRANPDGAFERPTIGINGQWPLPIIRATKGDTVIVNVENGLGNQTTTLHFHGLYMNGSNHMDGPFQVTQCGIAPGHKFKYNFTINQPGTYWYHSHAKGQYPDGLRAPLIIEDPDSPFLGQYDEEVILSVSDWYHGEMATIIPKFISRFNPTGAEPIPDAVLLNDTQNLKIPMTPGKTYLFRMVNMGAFAGQYVWFEGHNFSIVEVDGIYTQPANASLIYLGAAQRCSFLLTALNDTSANYAFVSSMDTSLFDKIPSGLQYNGTGWLVYDDKKPFPDAALIEDDNFNEFDDYTLVPYDQEPLYEDPVQSIELVVMMNNLGDGANYAFFNNVSYAAPIVPTLYTVLSSGELSTNSFIYGGHTNSFILDHNQVIELVINNNDPGKHPFHLHGHAFQAVWRGAEDDGDFNDTVPVNTSSFPASPMRRDTFTVNPNGNLLLRFKSDNPGVWLFHCHIEWHVDSGLIATMIEAPVELQKSLTIPQDHWDACKADSTPYTGNAAGNTVNLLDLSGENSPPDPLPDGFTTRGKVALAFSIISALLGFVVISWYGLADMGKAEMENEKRRIAAMNHAAVLNAPVAA